MAEDKSKAARWHRSSVNPARRWAAACRRVPAAAEPTRRAMVGIKLLEPLSVQLWGGKVGD